MRKVNVHQGYFYHKKNQVAISGRLIKNRISFYKILFLVKTQKENPHSIILKVDRK